MTRYVINSGIVYFKTYEMFSQYLNLFYVNPLLYAILNEYFLISHKSFNVDPVVTSVWRKKKNDSGVHELWRAVDLRSKHYSSENKNHICHYFNSRYQYDHTRPEKELVIYHGKGDNEHFHFQTHPNTRSTTWA